ncbi:glycosyltransferase family 4 protein [Polynucleobacter sp. AP-Elch-400A-B2]|uniref:glycosyltransferase family 4 protein n=1 Tax=Polynucleobacter sp. AP-Elch-400A-B2 TaxID=2576930 RepID=UPI001BFE22BB|nr:glycosyltransferase family 4 protein [Polynucleobacter sp. AP-Elch-400A-B2]QWE24995.1 glycosyltransferase family 4 protein [Polynucleobacter sp. AP-Elch-400A-B2]
MKILHINHSDTQGGAARAAFRIHDSLLAAGITSRMWVNQSFSGDWTVHSPQSYWDRFMIRAKSFLGAQVQKLHTTNNRVLHSSAVFNSRWVSLINNSDFDVVNLHWVGGEMLSIADIANIKKPLVWTLHDMWPFCGAEHYTKDDRWKAGYCQSNRPDGDSGFDLDRFVWRQKKRRWNKPIQIIAPSKWLEKSAAESSIMNKWPIKCVSYPINVDVWQPIEPKLARQILGLPSASPLLLFGAMGGGQDERKGFDLLLGALAQIRDNSSIKNLEIVVFGERTPKNPPNLGFPVRYIGHLQDELSLKVLYSACDVMIVPSRQDNLPLTAIEAKACGTPVVAFDVGGLSDIIQHKATGYLAKAFNIGDLADGILWVLSNSELIKIGEAARESVVKENAYCKIAQEYIEIYNSMLAK